MRFHYTPIQQFENVLAALAISMVWLVPNHQLPWSAFHHELLMSIALGLVAIVLAWQTAWRVPMSSVVGVLWLVALVPWVQWLGGLVPKVGTAAVSSAYVAVMALAFMLAHAARMYGNRRLLDITFAALAIAAVVNVPVQWIQWLQWYSVDLDSLLMLLVTPIDVRQRPSGMILQPNQLATIHVWGLIGLSWFRHHRMLSTPMFGLLFAWVIVGMGLTQSRSGLLEMGLVSVMLTLAQKGESRRSILAVWWTAMVLLVLWSLHFNGVAVWLGVRPDAEARLTAIDGARIDAWRAFGAAILERPWLGYGLTDLGQAYVAVADTRPELFIGQRFAHSHNLVIDALLWFGVPLGLLLLGILSAWSCNRLLTLRKQPDNVLPLAVLGALGVHAMLELPHHFLYFLAPAALIAGWLMPLESGRLEASTLPRAVWAVSGVLVLGVAGWFSADYFPYQDRYTEWRFENNRVGKRPDVDIHAPRILNQIHDELTLYRLPLRPDMRADELEWISDTARSVNTPPAYYAAAKAYALAGNAEFAHTWMMRYNAIMGEQGMRTIQSIWSRDQALNPLLMSVQWPAYAGRNSTFRWAPEDAERGEPMPMPEPASHPAPNHSQ